MDVTGRVCKENGSCVGVRGRVCKSDKDNSDLDAMIAKFQEELVRTRAQMFDIVVMSNDRKAGSNSSEISESSQPPAKIGKKPTSIVSKTLSSKLDKAMLERAQAQVKQAERKAIVASGVKRASGASEADPIEEATPSTAHMPVATESPPRDKSRRKKVADRPRLTNKLAGKQAPP